MAAAPDGPETRPSAAVRAASIIFRSSIVDLLKGFSEAGVRREMAPIETQHFLIESFP